MKRNITEISAVIDELRTIREKMSAKDERFYILCSEFCEKLMTVPEQLYRECKFSLELPDKGPVIFSKPKVTTIDNMFTIIKIHAEEVNKFKSGTVQVCAYPENDELGIERKNVAFECINNILGEAETTFIRDKEKLEKNTRLKEISKYLKK